MFTSLFKFAALELLFAAVNRWSNLYIIHWPRPIMAYMMKDRDNVHPRRNLKAALLPSNIKSTFFITQHRYSTQVIDQTVLTS